MGEDFSLNLNGKDYLIKKKDVKDDTKLSKDDLEIEKNSVEESIFDEFQLEKGANGVGGDDSIFDAGEINTFMNRMDTEVDTDNDGKLSDDEITDFMEDTFGDRTEIDSRAVNGFKSFFASLSTAISGTQAADSTNGTGNTADVQGVILQYDDSKPGILKDETDTNRPEKEIKTQMTAYPVS